MRIQSSYKGGVQAVRAMGTVGRLRAAAPLAHRGLTEVITPGQLGNGQRRLPQLLADGRGGEIVEDLPGTEQRIAPSGYIITRGGTVSTSQPRSEVHCQ
jgi:hypothetical protein